MRLIGFSTITNLNTHSLNNSVKEMFNIQLSNKKSIIKVVDNVVCPTDVSDVQTVIKGDDFPCYFKITFNAAMWVIFADQRLAYSTVQGKQKQVVHSVMVQFNMVSAWRN